MFYTLRVNMFEISSLLATKEYCIYTCTEDTDLPDTELPFSAYIPSLHDF